MRDERLWVTMLVSKQEAGTERGSNFQHQLTSIDTDFDNDKREVTVNSSSNLLLLTEVGFEYFRVFLNLFG